MLFVFTVMSIPQATYVQKKLIDGVLARMHCTANDDEPPSHLQQDGDLLRWAYPPEEQTLAVVPQGYVRNISKPGPDGWVDRAKFDLRSLDLTPSPDRPAKRRSNISMCDVQPPGFVDHCGTVGSGDFGMRELLDDLSLEDLECSERVCIAEDEDVHTPSPQSKAKHALDDIMSGGPLGKEDLTRASNKALKASKKKTASKDRYNMLNGTQ